MREFKAGNKLLQRLKFNENSAKTGFDSSSGMWTPYIDSSKKAHIGYGHKLSDKKYNSINEVPNFKININGIEYNTKEGIPNAINNKLFLSDIKNKERNISELMLSLPKTAPINVKNSLFEMGYIFGTKGLENKFKKMITAVKKGDYKEAAKQIIKNGEGTAPSTFMKNNRYRASFLSNEMKQEVNILKDTQKNPTSPLRGSTSVKTDLPVQTPSSDKQPLNQTPDNIFNLIKKATEQQKPKNVNTNSIFTLMKKAV